MELELKHKLLSAGTDPQGGFWRYEAPWRALSRIGHDLIAPYNPSKGRPEKMRAPSTFRHELVINQGGIQNRDFNQADKELFDWAIENIQRVYPEIPNKPTGRMFLHFAEGMLKRATLKIK